MVKELKAEIKDLRARLVQGSPNVSAASVILESGPTASKTHDDTHCDLEVQSLKAQIKQLQQKINVMSVTHGQSPEQAQRPPSTWSMQPKGRPRQIQEDDFCYRCGDGHIATRCQAPENPTKVIQKLVRSLRKSKSERSETPNDTSKAVKPDCFSKKSQIDALETACLPKGLVGPTSTVSLKLNGQPCRALLDSGSQVTIVFDSWYSKHLLDVPIRPLHGLSIWGLSSSNYPYKGYIVVDASFPTCGTKVEETISILALVCPEPQGPQSVPVIFGTNASFFTRLAALTEETGSSNVAHSFRISLPYQELCCPQKPKPKESADCSQGRVKWVGPGSLIVPSKSELQAMSSRV